MFGHDHKDEDKKDEDLTVQPMPTTVNNGLLGIDDDDDVTQTNEDNASLPSAPPVNTDDSSFAPVSSPAVTKPSEEVPASTQSDNNEPVTQPVGSSTADDELLNIKRQALEELSPLIDHLEQSSEEKFRTTMMMIQASDNKELIPQAFTAAKEITDDKKRAQALLDIVNEINYFTHQKND